MTIVFVTSAITAPVAIASIDQAIAHAMSNVFGIMLHRTVRLIEKTPTPVQQPAGTSLSIIGSVGFVGRITGTVYLCFPEEFCKTSASHILGMSPAELEMEGPDAIKDVVGELTNMTVGGFKNILADLGYPCRLTLPVIMRGHHIGVSAIKSAHREVYHFESERHRVAADIQIMPD
jgi:chemotaxis protein CheX